MDSESKQRISLYLDKDVIKSADIVMKKYRFRSRNDFFTKAVESFAADKILKENKDELSERLAKAIAEAEKNNAIAISKGLFRYAVQLEMGMRMLAEQFEYKPLDIKMMRQEATNNVRRTCGKVRFDDSIAGYHNE